MSNVIRFLESMGSQAQWDSISKDNMEWALANAGIKGPLRLAILDKDVAGLQALLQQKPLLGYIELPFEEEEEEEEDGEQEPDEKDARLPPQHPTASTV